MSPSFLTTKKFQTYISLNDYPLSVCHQIICFGLAQPHVWVDNTESKEAILILESTWLIMDNVSVHVQTDNVEF